MVFSWGGHHDLIIPDQTASMFCPPSAVMSYMRVLLAMLHDFCPHGVEENEQVIVGSCLIARYPCVTRHDSWLVCRDRVLLVVIHALSVVTVCQSP